MDNNFKFTRHGSIDHGSSSFASARYSANLRVNITI